MTPTLTHIALHVRDLDACAAFYRDFCDLSVVHDRAEEAGRVLWLAERGREHDFVIVLLPNGPDRERDETDYSHFGFAVDSEAAVDALAAKAEARGCLALPPRREPYPVGYYCALCDPGGNMVEFSYGQPLGPGAEREA
jgi:catechol 2,3-dioxygenase-like lactoylglutathione lyase family enzyme